MRQILTFRMKQKSIHILMQLPSHPLSVGPRPIKRIPFQRLVLWHVGNIFSQNSDICGGYGSRLALLKLNLKHNTLWEF